MFDAAFVNGLDDDICAALLDGEDAESEDADEHSTTVPEARA
jgi:hypothetical protein